MIKELLIAFAMIIAFIAPVDIYYFTKVMYMEIKCPQDRREKTFLSRITLGANIFAIIAVIVSVIYIVNK